MDPYQINGTHINTQRRQLGKPARADLILMRGERMGATVKDLQQKRAEKQDFSLDDVLGTATVKTDSKAKSKTPIVTVPVDTQRQIARYREIAEQLDSLESEASLLKAEIVEAVAPQRLEACQTGYAGSVKAAGSDGMYLTISWQHKYSKIEMSDKAFLVEHVGEELFPTYFAPIMEITVKPEAMTEPRLRDLVAKVGPQEFAETFEVRRWLYPTKAYTEQFHTFSERIRATLQRIVRQYAPSFRTK